MVTIKIEGVELAISEKAKEIMADNLLKQATVNGCGAGSAKFDFVPDTIYGLRVTHV